MSQQIVLLIDDSEPIHPLVKAALADESLTIHSATDAKVGIALAAKLRPDLILLDVEMPGVDGFETCRQLKADPITANLPIIFLTGHMKTDEMVHGLELGATDYVTKPFQLAELLSRVRAALRTGRLIRLLEEKALIDALTGLGNRAMFNQRFAAETAMRARFGQPLSCILLDVDRFKGINDKYGHPFGDHVLTKIGEALIDISRTGDVVCRYGGEEFVILAPHTCAADAARVAERIRVAIESIPFSRQGESITVTCSFGVADAVGTADPLMLERADQALYLSKEHGRNRVSVAPMSTAQPTVAA